MVKLVGSILPPGVHEFYSLLGEHVKIHAMWIYNVFIERWRNCACYNVGVTLLREVISAQSFRKTGARAVTTGGFYPPVFRADGLST